MFNFAVPKFWGRQRLIGLFMKLQFMLKQLHKLFFLLLLLLYGQIAAGQDRPKEEQLRAAIREAQNSGNKSALVDAFGDIAAYFAQNGNYAKAGLHYEKAVRLARDNDLHQKAYNLSFKAGSLFRDYGETSEAINFFKKSVKAGQLIQSNRKLAEALLQYGACLKRNAGYDKAIEVFLELKKIAEFKLNDKELRLATYRQLRETYRLAGNQERYMHFYRKTEVKDLENQKSKVEQKASQLASKKEKQEEVIEEQSSEIKKISDSLRIANYKRRLQEEIAKSQEQQIENQELALQKQRMVRNFLIAGLVIMILFSILWYMQFQQKKKAYKQLEARNKHIREQKNHIEEQAKQLAFSNRELEKLSIVARETSNAVAIINPDFTLEWTNDAFARIHEYDPAYLESLKNKPIPESEHHIFRLDKFKESISKQRVVQYETSYRYSGVGYSTQVTITPITDKNGQTNKLISIETDITDIKNLEDFKANLSRMIVHDLKNPLNSILGITDLMAEDGKVSFVKVAANQMLNMVENILDVQKLESDRMQLHIEHHRVKEMIDQAMKEISLIVELSRENKIHLTHNVENGLQAEFDFENMKRVLVNLLSNAIKYTPDGGEVSISATKQALDEKNYVKFSVKDTGIGISKDMQQKIFKQFIQVDPHDSGKSRSTGVGLTYCKLMTEAHGGEIHVESERGRGSEFYFYLPLTH